MLETAQWICETLRDNPNSGDFQVSVDTMKYPLSAIQSVQGSIALEKNLSGTVMRAFDDAKRVAEEAKRRDEKYILQATTNLTTAFPVFGKPQDALEKYLSNV